MMFPLGRFLIILFPLGRFLIIGSNFFPKDASNSLSMTMLQQSKDLCLKMYHSVSAVDKLLDLCKTSNKFIITNDLTILMSPFATRLWQFSPIFKSSCVSELLILI
jgi:hypothetical protein